MEKSYSFIINETIDQFSMNGTSIRYGKQPDISNKWKEIIAEGDEEKRNIIIDELISDMEENYDKNGFWRAEDEILINVGAFGGDNRFCLDDKSLYYDFFTCLKTQIEKNNASENPKNEGFITYKTIKSFLNEYFGEYNGDLRKRNELTDYDVETGECPSISLFKGAGCAACVERASVSHNLWLLMGRESYFVLSPSCMFETTPDEGHAFNIIKNSMDNFMLFDSTLHNFGQLPGNPIDDMLMGKPFVVKEPFLNKGCYANAKNLDLDKDFV